MKFNISLRLQVLIASLLSFFTIALIIHSWLSNNSFLLGYSLGFSAFSSYFLQSKMKEYKKEVEKIWNGLTKSTTL